MSKQDDMSLTPNQIVDTLKAYYHWSPADRGVYATGDYKAIAEAQLAKVLKQRLDRPDLREVKMERLKTYLESHTIEQVSSETGISQILALYPDIEVAKRLAYEDGYKLGYANGAILESKP